MRSFDQVSEYFSEDNKRRSSVRRELGTNRYVVTFINDAGSAFTTSVDSEEQAEHLAENWVLE